MHHNQHPTHAHTLWGQGRARSGGDGARGRHDYCRCGVRARTIVYDARLYVVMYACVGVCENACRTMHDGHAPTGVKRADSLQARIATYKMVGMCAYNQRHVGSHDRSAMKSIWAADVYIIRARSLDSWATTLVRRCIAFGADPTHTHAPHTHTVPITIQSIYLHRQTAGAERTARARRNCGVKTHRRRQNFRFPPISREFMCFNQTHASAHVHMAASVTHISLVRVFFRTLRTIRANAATVAYCLCVCMSSGVCCAIC